MVIESERQQKRFVGYAICLLGFALTIWAFYPGMMSPDSIASLSEGRSGIIYDQNSPVMSFVWGYLDRVVTGPAPMLVFQVGTFWVAIACLWEAAYRESLALGLACVAFPFLPHVISQLPVIWKDVAMASALTAAVALIYLARRKNSRIALLLSPAFLFYGLAARLNSLPAVLPIAIWSAFVASSVFGIAMSRMTATAAGLGYLVVLFAAVLAFQNIVTGGLTSYPFQYVQLYDLAAISIAEGEPNFPSYVTTNPDFSVDSVRANYTTTTVGPLVYQDQVRDGLSAPLAIADEATEIDELRTTWRREIASNPGAYVAHRAAVFGQLIGLGPSVNLQYWDLDLSRNPPEFSIDKNPANALVTGYLGAFRRPVMQTFFFRAVVWILACFYFGYRAIRSRSAGDWSFVLVLASSSLLYTFAYFFTAPAADYRYVFWPAIASTIATIFGIHLVLKERSDARALEV